MGYRRLSTSGRASVGHCVCFQMSSMGNTWSLHVVCMQCPDCLSVPDYIWYLTLWYFGKVCLWPSVFYWGQFPWTCLWCNCLSEGSIRVFSGCAFVFGLRARKPMIYQSVGLALGHRACLTMHLWLCVDGEVILGEFDSKNTSLLLHVHKTWQSLISYFPTYSLLCIQLS